MAFIHNLLPGRKHSVHSFTCSRVYKKRYYFFFFFFFWIWHSTNSDLPNIAQIKSWKLKLAKLWRNKILFTSKCNTEDYSTVSRIRMNEPQPYDSLFRGFSHTRLPIYLSELSIKAWDGSLIRFEMQNSTRMWLMSQRLHLILRRPSCINSNLLDFLERSPARSMLLSVGEELPAPSPLPIRMQPVMQLITPSKWTLPYRGSSLSLWCSIKRQEEINFSACVIHASDPVFYLEIVL